MGGPSPNSAYFSLQMSIDEKEALDAYVRPLGISRNAFLRQLIIKEIAPKRS